MSTAPATVSIRVAAAFRASVLLMVSMSLLNPSSPNSIKPMAARLASEPNIVAKAKLRCSSVKPFREFCSSPAMSAMLLRLPLAS